MRLQTAFLFITTLFFATQSYASVQFYKVIHVPPDDTLNVRTGPGTQHPILLALPYDAKDIEIISDPPTSKWVVISLGHSRKTGWVNRYYLDAYNREIPSSYQCGGTEPFWSIEFKESETNVDIMSGVKFSIPQMLNIHAMNTPDSSRVLTGSDTNHHVMAFVREATCNNGMSDHQYDYTVTAVVDNKAFSGCCDRGGE
jgi:uncharacterized membrane protein